MIFENIFDFFLNSVFPFVGDFFGRISSLACMRFEAVFNMFQGTNIIPYINLYTGTLEVWEVDLFGSILGNVVRVLITPVYQIMLALGVNDMPFFIGAIIYLVFIIGVVKLIFSLFGSILGR